MFSVGRWPSRTTSWSAPQSRSLLAVSLVLLAAAVLALAIFLLTSPAAEATGPFQTGDKAVVDWSRGYGLRVRAEPGLSSAVLAWLPEGTRVKVLAGPQEADGFEWYKVSDFGIPGLEGWAAGDWLWHESEAVTATPQGNVAQVAQPSREESRALGEMAVVDWSQGYGLKVRKGPGIAYAVLAWLPEGTKVRVLSGPEEADGYAWYRIGDFGIPGLEGWVAGKWLWAPESSLSVEQSAQPVDPNEQQPLAQDQKAASPEAATAPAPKGRVVWATVTGYNGAEFGNPWNGLTRMQTRVRWGVVAVDPDYIPLGSRLNIEGFADTFSAEDTGNGVKGFWVDIWFPDVQSALDFGTSLRRVTILD